jgi:hypothetical protein
VPVRPYRESRELKTLGAGKWTVRVCVCGGNLSVWADEIFIAVVKMNLFRTVWEIAEETSTGV